jgi:3-oxoacyl-[acyl-carrier protein] reductase
MSKAAQKVALVTGAARGIGLATAKRFLADGWCVALLDIDDETLNRTHTDLPGPTRSSPFSATWPTLLMLPGRLRSSQNNSAGSMP